GWAQHFQVSARNPFALLEHVGEDLPGAVQMVPAARLDAVMSAGAGAVQWLSEEELGGRLRAVLRDAAETRQPSDVGHFSLAGAQPKLALAFDAEQRRWGVPSGRAPTTHIFKPPTGDFAHHDSNELFCLRLAQAVGFPVPSATVQSFAGQSAIVVERYDRLQVQGRWHRIHQEDMCQALGIFPWHKYQNEGGPGVEAIAKLLQNHSRAPAEDCLTFLKAQCFNWVIGGTDAHAKNYALLHGAGGDVRLAPLYDLGSFLPYRSDKDFQKAKLAMRIDGEYRFARLRCAHWQALLTRLQVHRDLSLAGLAALATAIGGASQAVAQSLIDAGLDADFLQPLACRVRRRAVHCATLLESTRLP
ncbi:MAG: HipA domain-containing protein, partial [Polyangiales bacterium]